MIILPDRNIPRAKFLIPVLDKEWREPSRSILKDQFGNSIHQTNFRIRAKTHDGVVLWTGWFDDRADFDAFLWAVSLGTINQEKSLWDLPTPMWPGFDPGLVYDFATVNFFTGPVNTITSWNRPNDWGINTSIEAIGGGGGGATRYYGTGGGGGAYAKTISFDFSSGQTVAYFYVGDKGTGAARGGTSGNNGSVSWFCINNSQPTNSTQGVLADRGKGGGLGGGGQVASCIGDTKYAGGNGGSYNPSFLEPSGGGGGAAGMNGAGGNGYTPTNRTAGGAGGTADAGLGGSGGTYLTAATTGTEWGASYGSGGGGAGGCGFYFPEDGFPGANYGGGGGAGGGGWSPNSAGGDGGQGLIVVTYTPRPSIGFNSPILGM